MKDAARNIKDTVKDTVKDESEEATRNSEIVNEQDISKSSQSPESPQERANRDAMTAQDLEPKVGMTESGAQGIAERLSEAYNQTKEKCKRYITSFGVLIVFNVS